jgi:hypothetical protein
LPTALAGFELMFQGSAGGVDSRRFSTAFTPSASMGEVVGGTLLDCATQCSQQQQCLGFFYWVKPAGVHACVLLNDVGTAAGVSTGTASSSYRKVNASTTASPLLAGAGCVLVHQAAGDASSPTARRFATAFDDAALLHVVEGLVSSGDCAHGCLALPNCVGVFFWELSAARQRCRFLHTLGLPAGLPSGTISQSLACASDRFDARAVGSLGFTVTGTGLPNANPVRFLHGFNTPAQVLGTVMGSSALECAAACAHSGPGCRAMFAYWPNPESSMLRCVLLKEPGPLVATSTVSISLLRSP